jgi:hypothetical protein
MYSHLSLLLALSPTNVTNVNMSLYKSEKVETIAVSH